MMTEVDPKNEDSYCVCKIRSRLEESPLPQEGILTQAEACGYSEDEIFAIKLALEEALTNAIKHGNRCDPGKCVTVRYAVTPEILVVLVRDEGEGFSPDKVPDPTSADRLNIPNGRGIMLLRAYMDELEYRDQGREVRFVKRRTAS